jgi:hypothetical protein
MSKIFLRHTLTKKIIDILILYLYTFSLYENASLIIFSANVFFQLFWFSIFFSLKNSTRNTSCALNYISTLITYAIYALCVFCCSQKLLNYFNFQSFVFKCTYQKHIVCTQLYICVYYLYCLSHMVLRCYQILLNMLVFNMLFLSVHSINISCVLNYISTFLLQSRLKVNCMRDWRNHFSIISN